MPLLLAACVRVDWDEVFLVEAQVAKDGGACKAGLAACICHGRKSYRLRLLAGWLKSECFLIIWM